MDLFKLLCDRLFELLTLISLLFVLVVLVLDLTFKLLDFVADISQLIPC